MLGFVYYKIDLYNIHISGQKTMNTDQLCFCIPRISVNTNKQFILNKFKNLELGDFIIRFIEIPLKNDPSYKKILIKMSYKNQLLLENVKNYFSKNGYIKFVYQMPWYWKIYLNDRQK